MESATERIKVRRAVPMSGVGRFDEAELLDPLLPELDAVVPAAATSIA